MERELYRSQHTGQQREIWQPGDGDGEVSTDYFGRQGDPLPLAQRWRLFQSDIGPIKPRKNEPPKNVFLDDRAVWELVVSEVPRAQLGAHWPHDFTRNGNVRVRRPHCGRPAIKDTDVKGEVIYQSVTVGKDLRYHLTGEKGYAPIVYMIPSKVTPKRKEFSSQGLASSRAHHNQYTPKDQLVKNGATSTAKSPKYQRPHVNRLLLKQPSPPMSDPARTRAMLRKPPVSSNRTDVMASSDRTKSSSHDQASNMVDCSGRHRISSSLDAGMQSLRKVNRHEDDHSKRQKSSYNSCATAITVTSDDPMQRLKARLSEEKVAHMLKENENEDLKAALKKSQVEFENLKNALKQSQVESERYKEMLKLT